MDDNSDTSDPDQERRFPLSDDDLFKIRKVIKLIRSHLPDMKPVDVRKAANALLALERLPDTTLGVHMTFGFAQPNSDGNFGWADIEISEDELRFGIGEHFYSPSVGGDTEVRTVFETQAGGDWQEGDINDWLPVASVIASEGHVSVEDYSEIEEDEWYSEDDD